MDKKLIGKSFVNDNKGILGDDGYWTVTVLMTETFYYDDGSEDVETIESKCMDTNYHLAHQTALASAMIQLREEVYDRHLTSLIEARQKFGRLNDNGTNNKDTITQ